MGMGGISTAEDVIEMIMAEANAVQIGAANLVEFKFICNLSMLSNTIKYF